MAFGGRSLGECQMSMLPFQSSGLGLAAKMPAPCSMTGALAYKSWPSFADPPKVSREKQDLPEKVLR